MNTEPSVQTAFCSSYENLLEECQFALQVWNRRRDEIFHSGLRSSKFDDELFGLQAKYAKALNRLQKHAHDCPLCQLACKVFEIKSQQSSDILVHK